MLGRTKTCPRRHAYPGTGLVTSSAPTIPRIASHCHRVVLVLCSLCIAFLFVTSYVQALWYTPSLVYHHTPADADLATTEPIVMPWQGGGRSTITLSREKVRQVGEKFPRSTER